MNGTGHYLAAGIAIRWQESKMAINRNNVPVLHAGPQIRTEGLGQVNVLLPLNLRGSGRSKVVLTADGQSSNTPRSAFSDRKNRETLNLSMKMHLGIPFRRSPVIDWDQP